MGDEADAIGWLGEGEYYARLDEIEANDKYHANNKSKMSTKLKVNKRAEIGCTIECTYCGRKVLKKTKDHAFCGAKYKIKGKSSCKDSFYNYTIKSRRRNNGY